MSDRFWSKVKKTDGCWEWTASCQSTGYGQFRSGGRVLLAHRLAYESLVGPIPEGLQIDHLCRNRACVNPAHLEPVTSAENTRRGNAGQNMSRKTHCPQGHPYDEENTYRSPRGGRYCKECRRLKMIRWYAAHPRTKAARETWAIMLEATA